MDAGARILFCSGQLGVGPDDVVPEDASAQAALCFLAGSRLVLRDARVPRALVEAPAGFGGRIERDCLRGDLLIEDGRVRRLLAPGDVADGHAASDLGGRVLLPRLVEPHCHLDKYHTVSRLGPVGGDLHRAIEDQRRDRARWTRGDLHRAIEDQRRDRARWTRGDLRERSGRGLDELHSSGCGSVRTHVNWDADLVPEGAPPLAWDVIGELACEIAPHMPDAAACGSPARADTRSR